MNYKKIYDMIIENRLKNKYNGYTEEHHIIPKSCGGSDSKNNLVSLSAREHFICHLLLTKIYKKNSIEWIKMFKAFMRMYSNSDNQYRYTPSRWYSYCKENFSKAQSLNQSGCNNSQYGKKWIFNKKLRQNKSVYYKELSNYLENGWELGRKFNWDCDKKIQQNVQNNSIEYNIKLYTEYYSIYNKYGWSKFIEITNYNKSQQNLVMLFKRYVKEFKPQNGKKRGLTIERKN